MPFSSGTFALYTPGNPVVSGTTISSTWAINTLNDIATGLTTCLLKDGSQTVTANIPMSSFKFTGLGAGTATGNSLRYEQLFNATSVTLIGPLLFTDASFDIGASGATRPRNIFLSGNIVAGGNLTVTNIGCTAITATATVSGGAFSPTSASVPSEGMYKPQANSIAFAAGSAIRAQIFTASADNNGEVIERWQSLAGVTHTFQAVSATGYNAANSAFQLGKDNSTGRSLSSGGTNNASGADYAEYEIKRDDCGDIAKGDVVGFDAEGLLTDQWALAVTFGVKSTNPSYVGGDTWGAGLEVAALEAARAKVDRIAYAGKVPVNVMGATPGQWIVPVRNAKGIDGEASSTFDPQAVGRVRRILPDGRAEIAL